MKTSNNGAKKDVETVLETVTPDMAAKYLENNFEDNRAVRQAWVKQLSDSIVRGEWRITHQGVAFDTNGKLIDGQHRLMAICQAGKSVKIQVTRGLDPKVYRFVDCGQKRSPADRLKLCGDQRTNRQAVAIVICYIKCSSGNTATPPISLIENTFLEQADAVDKVATVFRSRIIGITRADVGAAIACYMSVHPEQGLEFLTHFTLGEELERGDPALKLRNFFLTHTSRIRQHEAYWKTLWCTKMHHEGRKVTSVQTETEDWRGNIYNRLAWERARSKKAELETKTVSRVARGLSQK